VSADPLDGGIQVRRTLIIPAVGIAMALAVASGYFLIGHTVREAVRVRLSMPDLPIVPAVIGLLCFGPSYVVASMITASATDHLGRHSLGAASAIALFVAATAFSLTPFLSVFAFHAVGVVLPNDSRSELVAPSFVAGLLFFLMFVTPLLLSRQPAESPSH
jgi:hypothetical protein